MSLTKRTTVSVLGSTGSIGCNSCSLLAAEPERFNVLALTAQENVEKLIEQARNLRPQLAVIGNEAHYATLKSALAGTGIETSCGAEGLLQAASLPAERVITAIVGAAALAPTLTAIRRGAVIALANKECLVSAGSLMIEEVRKHNATLLPVDSEHSAIFQIFDFDNVDSIEKVTITASGGPFRNHTLEQMRTATPEQAICHPTWNMGAKISVDSATLMNKGLELIEAYYLFPVSEAQLDVIIHPESIIHGMVSYTDGSVLAQLCPPDMRVPIAHALAWPARMTTPTKRLDLATLGKLTFAAPDFDRFPSLSLARQALQAEGAAPTILNAANEIAVHRFLSKEIGFLDIAKIVASTLESAAFNAPASLDDVFAIDREARAIAQRLV